MTQRRWLLAALTAALLAAPVSAQAPKKRAALPHSDDDVRALAAQIDRLTEARWKEAGARPSAAASDAAYQRRVYLDLIGRIPPITEVRDFIDNPATDKREQLVRELVLTEDHAAHLARVWRVTMLPQANDPVFGQGFGFTFENWLKIRLHERAGYDQIVREIVTVGAAGGRGGNTGAAVFFQANEGKAENLAAATSRLFLGVKLECAQCHDHPFCKLSREQFWQHAAFFPNQGQPAATGREITIPGTQKVVKPRFLDGKLPEFKAGTDPRVTLADWMTAADNPFFARNAANRTWEYLFGTGLIDPVDEPSDENPPSHPELLDLLAKEFADHKFDVIYLVRAIAASKAYQRSSKAADGEPGDRRLFARMSVRALSAEQLFDSLVVATGMQGPASVDPRIAGRALGTPRFEFLSRFPPQEKRTEAQTSILQALYLMNGRFMSDATTLERSPALKVIAEADTTTARRIDELYMITLSRKPSDAERERLVAYVDRGGPSGDPKKALADVFWALLNSSEFFLNH